MITRTLLRQKFSDSKFEKNNAYCSSSSQSISSRPQGNPLFVDPSEVQPNTLPVSVLQRAFRDTGQRLLSLPVRAAQRVFIGILRWMRESYPLDCKQFISASFRRVTRAASRHCAGSNWSWHLPNMKATNHTFLLGLISSPTPFCRRQHYHGRRSNSCRLDACASQASLESPNGGGDAPDTYAY